MQISTLKKTSKNRGILFSSPGGQVLVRENPEEEFLKEVSCFYQ